MRFVYHPTPLWTFLAATCLMVTAACTTLRPVEPDELAGPDAPDTVRVAEQDHSVVVFHQPRAVGDTLVGTAHGATTLSAQIGPERHGFWTGFSLGYGRAQSFSDYYSGYSSNGSPVGRGTGSLKLGAAISPHVALGADLSFWGIGPPTDQHIYLAASGVGSLALEGYVYPDARGGFFLNGGLGKAFLFDATGTGGLRWLTNYDVRGPEFVVGAGYDVRVSHSLSVTPAANLYLAWAPQLYWRGFPDAHDYTQYHIDFSVGITYQKRR
jgi:hypothetical protein